LFQCRSYCFQNIFVLDYVVEVLVAGDDAGEASVVCPETVSVGGLFPLVQILVVAEYLVSFYVRYVVFCCFFKFV
jgi:hypothetical protein